MDAQFRLRWFRAPKVITRRTGTDGDVSRSSADSLGSRVSPTGNNSVISCPHSALLNTFLKAGTDSEADAALQALFDQCIEPVICRVARSRSIVMNSVLREARGTNLRPWDSDVFEDAVGEARATLLLRLHRLRQDRLRQARDEVYESDRPLLTPIANIAAYAAVTAEHSCDVIVRHRNPGRVIIENRLRYLLRHTNGLTLWEEEGCVVCGFVAWREGTSVRVASAGLREDPAKFLQKRFPNLDLASLSDAAFCAAVFDAVGGPVAFQELVSAFVICRPTAYPAPPVPSVRDSDTGDTLWETVADSRADVLDAVVRRDQLHRVWEEVQQLPPRQCVALLMNLRDAEGHGVIALLPILGIATKDEIAAALRMSSVQLDGLWEGLPLEDNEIAELLSATRQQVINLRKVARERLARRFRL
jgi:hypothetical protein